MSPSNELKMDHVPPSCPDPEALAAWLDQGVTDTEREQIEAHLAACDDCRVLVACVLESQTAVVDPRVVAAQADEARQTARLVVFPRKNIVWGAASVVAAAAALVVSMQVAPSWWASWRTVGVEQRLADLADAVGNERTVEARLTGGFGYGPLRAPVRSGGSSAATTDNWTLFAAAGRIREDAERDPTAANLHALGLAHLVLGGYDEAVRALEDAVAEAPDVAQYQSDLAGGYLARARALDRPDDLPRALGAAERAVKGNENLLEARFNRALALEALFLEDQARQAWQDYVARDSGSGWADEARRHLEKLQRGAEQRGPQRDLARNNSPPPITDTSVEAGLDWLLRQGLPAWADAILASDSERAAREHSSLTAYAEQISTASEDPFPAALVSLLDDARQPSRESAVTFQHLGLGLAQVEAGDVADGEKELRIACGNAPEVLSLLCDVELGMLDVVHRDQTQAQRRFVASLAAGRADGYAYIEGRAQRLEGYRLLFRGDYSGASENYRAGFEVFQRTKYQRQVTNLASQLADLYELLGLPVDAWRWRSRALSAATRGTSASQQYATRFGAAALLGRQGEYDAAQTILPAMNDPAFGSIRPLRWVLAMLERSKFALATGNLRLAHETVSTASAVASESQDFRAERLRTNILSAQASVLRAEGNLAEAHTAVTGAIDGMGPERPQYKAAALLERAKIRTSAGTNLGGAEDDVRAAIALLAVRGAPGQPVRLDDAKAAFQAVAALVSTQPALRTTSGLLLAEQLRELLDGVPEGARFRTVEALERALRLDEKGVAYYFLFGDDSLLTWVVRPDGIRLIERRITTRQVERLAALLAVQVARGSSADELWRRPLSDLYDLLLRDLPGLDGATNIVVVPEGPLNQVPFGALIDRTTGTFLFERATVRLASNLAFAFGDGTSTALVGAGSSVLSIGEPSLRNAAASGFRSLERARNEAYEVAALYPKSAVLVAEGATKAQFLAKLPTANVVHFAGHAVAASSEGQARLLLAGSVTDPDTALTSTDLMGRVSRARVVLAACETAADGTQRPAGVASITAMFLRSGAASVIGTLWEVDDVASEPFFLSVHRALVSGQPASVAVSRAQRACYASMSCRAAAATWIGTAAYGLE